MISLYWELFNFQHSPDAAKMVQWSIFALCDFCRMDSVPRDGDLINVGFRKVPQLTTKTNSDIIAVTVVINNEPVNEELNASNVTQNSTDNSVCVASFTPTMTMMSTFLSFIMPGFTIVVANIGKNTVLSTVISLKNLSSFVQALL